MKRNSIPIPVSLLGGAAVANIAMACPAAHQEQQEGGAQPGVGGDVAPVLAGEEVEGAGAIHPLAPPPPAAGGPDEPFVSVYGPPNQKDVINLMKDAKSTKHLLRHKPFNRYCEDCCKSKMAAKRHFKGAYKRQPKKWGEIITADHLVSHKKGKKHGIHGFRNAVNIKDLWSGLICSVPVKNKGHEEARRALKYFCGGRKIQRIFSDNVSLRLLPRSSRCSTNLRSRGFRSPIVFQNATIRIS